VHLVGIIIQNMSSKYTIGRTKTVVIFKFVLLGLHNEMLNAHM